MEHRTSSSIFLGLKIGIIVRFLIIILTCIISILLGCQANPANTSEALHSVPYFPVRKEYVNGGLDNGMVGNLVIEDNAVRIRSTAYPGEPLFGVTPVSMLAIWPQGYSLEIKGDKIQVLDRTGESIAVMGDYVYVGGNGGWGEEEKVNSLLSDPIPVGIRGPYWVISPPAYPMELYRGLFHHQNIKPDSPNSVLEGTLILEKGLNKGYLCLNLDNGNKVLPLWPPGTYCRILNYKLNMVDEQGKSLVAVGEKIKINGAEIPPELLGKYTGMQTFGIKLSFWYVDEIVKE